MNHDNFATAVSMKLLTILLLGFTLTPIARAAGENDCVVFLHGLARTSASMGKLADAFEDAGYRVANISYPSRDLPIEELAPMAVQAGIEECSASRTVHFVTHSLGGILVRHYLEDHEIDNLGRVVMIAPPNRGSEVVDKLEDTPGFELLNGPAGSQLGTDHEDIPAQLGPAQFEVGVIAGTRTVNFILSQYLPNPDDGKVSLESTKVEGMADFVALPHSHSFIMRASDVIEQALAFIGTGGFMHEAR